MSNSAEQLIYQASLLIDEGELEKACEALEEAIQLSEITPDRKLELVRARTLLGELLLHIGENEKALDLFEAVLAGSEGLDPADIELEVRVAREQLAKAAGLE
ncbi:MAG TPA: tetratricopeptide repeat protein [Thermoanaerobaculia bacterium]